MTQRVPNEPDVRWTIARHAASAHLADMIHIVAARGADIFASFEKKLATHAGPDPVLPVELVT